MLKGQVGVGLGEVQLVVDRLIEGGRRSFVAEQQRGGGSMPMEDR